ncbi:hypothetical protein EV359DRAFT_79224 [Lentinula novae-zelandiae]|nr:hypothetical protein EV359DRAFT_79224 [Lentinula novae-zelandiae]
MSKDLQSKDYKTLSSKSGGRLSCDPRSSSSQTLLSADDLFLFGCWPSLTSLTLANLHFSSSSVNLSAASTFLFAHPNIKVLHLDISSTLNSSTFHKQTVLLSSPNLRPNVFVEAFFDKAFSKYPGHGFGAYLDTVHGTLRGIKEGKDSERGAATSSSSPQNPAPSRSALLSSALSRNVLNLAPPTVQKLYHALEVDFDPLTLCESVAPLLEELGGGESTVASAEDAENNEVKEGTTKETTPYASYLPLLHQALLSRLLTHLSEVYSSIKISFLIDLLAPLNTLNSTEGTTGITVFTPASIESYIMSCARRGDLDVRIDHAEGSIVFIDEPFSMATSSTGTSADAQASPSGASGASGMNGEDGATIDDSYKPVQPSATALVRTRLSSVAGCLSQSLRELEGQGLVAPAPSPQYSEDSTEDSAQLSQEERIKSLLASLPAYRKTLLLRLLEGGMGGILKGMGKEGREAVEKLTTSTDPIDTTSLIKTQVLALERDKSLRLSRLKTISKRFDHLERAYRVSEMPLLKEDYSVQQGRDRVEWEVRGKEMKEEERKIWEEEMARLARTRDDWEDRKSTLLKRKGEEFALRREKAQRKIEPEKSQCLAEVLKHQAEVRAAAEREAARLLEIEAEEKAARECEAQALLEKE